MAILPVMTPPSGLIIYTLLPPLAIGCVAGAALVYEWHVRRVASLTPRRKQMLIRGIFTLTNLVYMGVAEKVLGAFQPCDDVQDGQVRMTELANPLTG